MTKLKVCIIVSVSVTTATILIIAQQQAKLRLQEEVQFLREQRERFAEAPTQNTQSSILIAESPRRELSPSEPNSELLRLRGEIARLRRSLDELGQLQRAEHDEVTRLREEDRQVRGSTFIERNGLSGIDTNSLPEITPAATKAGVLAELQRVEAKIVYDTDGVIVTETKPTPLTNSVLGAYTAAIYSQLFFEDGRLSSRLDLPLLIPTKKQTATLEP